MTPWDGRVVALPLLAHPGLNPVYRWTQDKTGWHLRRVPDYETPDIAELAQPWTASPCPAWNRAQAETALKERGIEPDRQIGMIERNPSA